MLLSPGREEQHGSSHPRRERHASGAYRQRMHVWRPRQESNLDLPLRRGLFYPLDYGAAGPDCAAARGAHVFAGRTSIGAGCGPARSAAESSTTGISPTTTIAIEGSAASPSLSSRASW